MNCKVLNTNFEMINPGISYKSLIWTDRFYEYGSFEMILPAVEHNLADLKPGYYLAIDETEHTMIIENTKISYDSEEGYVATITGRSLESILTRRVIWGKKIIQQSVSSACVSLLNECIISPTYSDRKINNFIYLPSNIPEFNNSNMNRFLYGDNLYDIISEVCKLHHVGFKITLTADNKFTFTFYSSIDKSYAQMERPCVLFSSHVGNLISSSFASITSEHKNAALVLGKKNNTYRYVEIGSEVGLNRREIVINAESVQMDEYPDALYMVTLNHIGGQAIEDNQIKSIIEAQVHTEFTNYGRDYFVGDIVQIVDDYGNQGKMRIVEVTMSRNEEGKTIYPTFEVVEE